MLIEKRYFFQGHAVAAEAHIRQPERRVCFIQGAMALPVTGGFGQVQVERHECPIPERKSSIAFNSASAFVSGDFVDIEAASTQAGGKPPYDRRTRTITAAYVNGLNVLDRIRAHSLAAHLVLDDPRGKDEPQIRSGVQNPITNTPEPRPIEGLTIDGFPVNIEFDPIFDQLPTLHELAERYDEDEDFRKEYRERFEHNGEDHSFFHPHRIPSYGGIIATSIVKKLSWADGDNPNARISGNTIQIGNLGKLYVAELLIEKRSRHLTLLRLRLDSDTADNDVYCDVRPNGEGWPPTGP